MPKNITAALSLKAFKCAPGTIGGDFCLSLVNADTGGVHDMLMTRDLVAQFNDVKAGNYIVTAVRWDVSGNPIGTEATSEPFTIEADAAPAFVSIDVPVSVRVTFL